MHLLWYFTSDDAPPLMIQIIFGCNSLHRCASRLLASSRQMNVFYMFKTSFLSFEVKNLQLRFMWIIYIRPTLVLTFRSDRIRYQIGLVLDGTGGKWERWWRERERVQETIFSSPRWLMDIRATLLQLSLVQNYKIHWASGRWMTNDLSICPSNQILPCHTFLLLSIR